MSDTWYYADQNKQLGPFGIEQLKATLHNIPDARNVLVWRPGFTNWMKAGDVPELSADLSAAPPFAGHTVPIVPAGAATPAVQPTTLELWFSFSGRINRAKYWLVSLVNLAIIVIAVGAAIIISYSNSSMAWIPPAAIILAVLVSSYAVAAKRLHDRDKSAWWIVVYYLIPAIISGGAGQTASQGMIGVTGLISFVIYLAAFIDLGCLRGTSGDNRFGPDPLAGQI